MNNPLFIGTNHELRVQLITMLDAVGYNFPDDISHLGAVAYAAAEELVAPEGDAGAAVHAANEFAHEALVHAFSHNGPVQAALDLMSATYEYIEMQEAFAFVMATA